MLRLYHTCLSAHLQELATQLEGNEFVTLLNWVQVYEGPELMGHPELNIDLKAEGLQPLLPKNIVDDLTNKYLATIEKNYKEWMNNTINREMRDWCGTNIPEADDTGHYQTTTPVIVFQMIDQHLQVAKTVNQALINRVLIISMDHLAAFAKQYKDAISKYSKAHFEDRELHKCYTPYMIAITNNCISFSDIAWKFRKQYRSATSGAESDKSFENVLNSFEKLREDSINYLLHELFLDVDKEISKVGTKEWLEGKFSVIENVCLTLEDYVHDYEHLKERNFDYLRASLESKLAKGYITAILQKKITFKDHNQREAFARKFVKEGEILKVALGKLPNYQSLGMNPKESPFECLPLLADFLKLKDLSIVFLEVSGLIKKYPDITVDHLTALLSLREDMAKTNVRKQVVDWMSELSSLQTNTKTIFSSICLN
ncbi:exocyst complex component 3-like protein [Leptotrombidium deliense]|uniref:Exocyst complex component 3-like protein n=1 Tax=Leptotrombidium deliense TaxID=299467 RepID=A0A443S3Q3_9ACAR|nr:exocyst complex component 3-like protein [Leptotrombidium deliense]